MRLIGVLAAALGCQSAMAAEVVWLGQPSAEQAARVAAMAGATRGPLSVAELRGLTTAATPEDDLALSRLESALRDSRAHEAQLDGELRIIEGIEPAVARVGLIRDVEQRALVFRALAYQGFAVDRFWGPEFETSAQAAPYRVFINDQAVERPWLDAFALDPLRKPTAHDIGEEPSRQAYDALRRSLAHALRVDLLVMDLPDGAQVFVDGEVREFDDVTVLQLLPGRHYVHVELDGHIIAREALRTDPGARVEVRLPLSQSVWREMVLSLKRGQTGPPPSSFVPFLQRLGGEVWIADASTSGVRVWEVQEGGSRSVMVGQEAEVGASKGVLADVSAAAWVGGGFVHGGDYPRSAAWQSGPWNTVAPHGGLELAWDRAWLRYGVGVDVTVPLGSEQVALVAENAQRARIHPHVVVGHPLAQLVVGYVFPHHVAVAGQATMPLPGDLLEARARLQVGGARGQRRDDGSVWTSEPWMTASIAVGVRLRP